MLLFHLLHKKDLITEIYSKQKQSRSAGKAPTQAVKCFLLCLQHSIPPACQVLHSSKHSPRKRKDDSWHHHIIQWMWLSVTVIGILVIQIFWSLLTSLSEMPWHVPQRCQWCLQDQQQSFQEDFLEDLRQLSGQPDKNLSIKFLVSYTAEAFLNSRQQWKITIDIEGI